MRRICLFIIACVFLMVGAQTCYGAAYHGNRRSDRLNRGGEVRKKKVVEVIVPAAVAVPLGPKKLIAVAEFENKTNLVGQAQLGTGMADQLITALINSGRFIVLERQSIEAILREQDFAASARITEGGSAGIGKLINAQILIQGAVTEFDLQSGGGGGGATIKGVSISISESKAHVAVDLRIYDTTTGQIMASKACKGTARASGGSFGYAGADLGFSAGGEAKTPLDFAVRDAINLAVNFIILELQKVPWEGRIAMVRNSMVYINCGRTAGILPGDQFIVYKKGEVITDPETGLTLGSEITLTGEIEVIKVEEKYSKAIPVKGGGFGRGDIIKYKGPKPPLAAVEVPHPDRI